MKAHRRARTGEPLAVVRPRGALRLEITQTQDGRYDPMLPVEIELVNGQPLRHDLRFTDLAHELRLPRTCARWGCGSTPTIAGSTGSSVRHTDEVGF